MEYVWLQIDLYVIKKGPTSILSAVGWTLLLNQYQSLWQLPILQLPERSPFSILKYLEPLC